MPSRTKTHFTAPIDSTYKPPAFVGFPGSLPSPLRDGLQEMMVEPHSLEKLRAFGRVVNGFVRATKRYRPSYLDLYAGPGVVSSKGLLVWGSPLMALQCADPFARLVFVEDDEVSYRALATRARQVARRGEEVTILNGGAEPCLDEAIAGCPRNGLTLALADPFRLDFGMDAVVKLATRLPKLDLLLLFAEDMDLTRNLQNALGASTSGGRVDAVFGDATWRSLYDSSQNNRWTVRRLREEYMHRLEVRAGFKYVGDPYQIRNSLGLPLYVLLYATRHQLGLKLWSQAAKPEQMTLF
jgi:three-Cys-motif partner protein